MKIFINNNTSSYCSSSSSSVETLPSTAHEKIARIFAQVVDALKSESDPRPLLSLLGVKPEDSAAVEQLTSLVKEMQSPGIRVTVSADAEESGVFFFEKPSPTNPEQFEKFAVFKVGRKRALIETTMRQIAYLLNLPHAIPGMFAALTDVPQDKLSGCIEELWNGTKKVYDTSLPSEESSGSDSETDTLSSESSKEIDSSTDSEEESDDLFFQPGSPKEIDWPTDSESDSDEGVEPASPELGTVVGILQPFAHERELSFYEFTLMTIFAMAIGARDAKKDGIKGEFLIDLEDCMPIRNEPICEPKRSPAALQLCYLDEEPRCTQVLPYEDVIRIAKIVDRWRIFEIVQSVSQVRIENEDRLFEEMEPGALAIDEGGCSAYSETQAIPHPINGDLNLLDSDSNPERTALTSSQLEAFMVRLNRIRDYTLLCAKNPEIPFTLNNLLSKVDMHGGGLIDAINTYKGIHQHVSPDAMSVLYNPHSMIGLVSPEKIFNEEAFTVPSSPVRIALDKVHNSSTSSSSSSPEHQIFDGFREEEN